MKRWISLMLSSLLLWATLPAAAARSAPEAWTAIRAIEDRAEALCSPQGETERRGAYAREVDQMILAVQAAPDYLPGSLERHGDFFFWESRDGRANGYSHSLRSTDTFSRRTASAGASSAGSRRRRRIGPATTSSPTSPPRP